ncbi:cytochrome P450 [Aspergillus alliaceus]|uniref:cytochrome P450 n=1 Tax=Petromyces alliaceus TaxID=209559 RepID=UPI0012A51BA8|nr:cytochrome P450 [Aspergillus alliaceus]KAB8238047.1 cytochrome P450 [Aspergillus alliaceus]
MEHGQALQDVLETDLLQLGGSAALLGIFLHITIFRTSFAVEEHLYNLLGLYAATVLALVSAYFTSTVYSPTQVLGRVSLIAFSFNTGLFSSISIYRLFFHRLHRFPGRFGSKLTRFYDAYLSAKNLQYNVELKKLHEKYGDFVRTGPREISILRKSAVPLIYGPQSECLKSLWYAQLDVDHTKISMNLSRDFDDHRKRRRAWDRAFSIKSLKIYEPRVIAQAGKLVAQIDANPGKPFDATAWTMFFSFDIMGDIGFGKDFNNLTTGMQHHAIRAVHDHMSLIGVLSHVPWLLNILSNLPGAANAFSGFFAWCADQIESRRKNWDGKKYPQDIVSWLVKAFVEDDVSAAPTELALHDDSRVVIVAGSETTASTLANAIYFLAKHPKVLTKLQAQLDEVMPNGPKSWTYDKAKSITYLDDIIHETLRIKPSVMTGGYRVTPPKGLQVDEVFIPGDVNVVVPPQLIQTDEKYYRAPLEFIPERWTERKAEFGTDQAPYYPFSMGLYGCVGKNLAMMSLRVVISTLVLRYNITFAPGETGEAFDKGALDTFTTILPPLQVLFLPRSL